LAQTWTPNSTYTILVYLNGTTIQAWTCLPVGNVAGYTLVLNTTSSVQQAATGAKSSGGAWVKDLLAWPLTYADSVITQSALRTTINVLPYGDSKTVDATTFKTDSYPQYLCRAIGASETPTRIATGGQSTAAARAVIDARLASAVGTPNYILYNLGANDVTAMPAQATWEADTAYILDAMHTKWPSAHVYLMRPWRRTFLTECNTLATWQLNVLATRSAWAHVGPDERVFLENGDDGARYTSDGVHPRIQEGYVYTAAQWKIALGL
jgi:lysophospholipase L1-like esterase